MDIYAYEVAPFMPVRRLNCTIPTPTYLKLKEICEQEDRTMSNVLKRLIEKAYEDFPEKKIK